MGHVIDRRLGHLAFWALVATSGCGASNDVKATVAPAAATSSGGGTELTEAEAQAIERAKDHPIAHPEPRAPLPEQQPPPLPTRPLYPEQSPPPVGSDASVGAQAEKDEAVVAQSAPPAAQREEQPPSPGPDYTWAPGYWYWYGGAYTWIGGSWILGRAGYVYVSPYWVHRPFGWAFVAGGWGVAGGVGVVAPFHRHWHLYPRHHPYYGHRNRYHGYGGYGHGYGHGHSPGRGHVNRPARPYPHGTAGARSRRPTTTQRPAGAHSPRPGATPGYRAPGRAPGGARGGRR